MPVFGNTGFSAFGFRLLRFGRILQLRPLVQGLRPLDAAQALLVGQLPLLFDRGEGAHPTSRSSRLARPRRSPEDHHGEPRKASIALQSLGRDMVK